MHLIQLRFTKISLLLVFILKISSTGAIVRSTMYSIIPGKQHHRKELLNIFHLNGNN